MNEIGLRGADEGQGQYLTFRLANEEYGIDILRVQEIKGWSSLTVVPGAASHVLGVINLRGAVVPIVSLRRRFSLPEAENTATTVVIVVRLESDEASRTVGLVVDGVSEVYTVDKEGLRPAPKLGEGAEAEFVRGLAVVDNKMVIMLDIDRLIDGDGVYAAMQKHAA
jgi:purine-binding chemotaxis protein CheW